MPQFNQEVADVVAVPELADLLATALWGCCRAVASRPFTDDRPRGFARSPGTLYKAELPIWRK